LLAAATPATGQAPYAGCSVPEAEAEVCPSVTDLAGSVALGISGDGTTAVGFLPRDQREPPIPMRWVNGIPVSMGPLPEGVRGGQANAASEDGSVIVGFLDFPRSLAAFRWENGAFEVLPRLSESSVAVDVSADGLTVLCQEVELDDQLGGLVSRGISVWRDGELTRITDSGSASAISADGSVIVGSFDGPALWFDGTLVALPLAAGFDGGNATGISASGTIVVGVARGPAENRAVRWEGDSMTPLDDVGSGSEWLHTYALDVSADGSIIVGSGTSRDTATEPFVWDEEFGLRRLFDVLSNELGLGVSDFDFGLALAVSDDGRVIVVLASPEPFIADITSPVGIDIVPGSDTNVIELTRDRLVSVQIFGTQLLDVDDINVDVLAFGPYAAPVEHVFHPSDANGDGYLDLEVRFETGETGIAAGDTEACLSGRAMGLPFEVCGPIEATLFGFGPGTEVPGCGRGFEGALALPALLLWWRRRGRSACHGRIWR
ncbi:MAG: hypothetical protein JSW43_04985, partial [Gemmatimonadota bacterium]